jgi:hypothetical protein
MSSCHSSYESAKISPEMTGIFYQIVCWGIGPGVRKSVRPELACRASSIIEASYGALLRREFNFDHASVKMTGNVTELLPRFAHGLTCRKLSWVRLAVGRQDQELRQASRLAYFFPPPRDLKTPIASTCTSIL